MAQAQLSEIDEGEPSRASRPVATFKQGGVEVSVWKNHTEQGDLFNTTIRNSYKDDKSGEWKETKSFSPTDLAVVAQLSGQAFQAIGELGTGPGPLTTVSASCKKAETSPPSLFKRAIR